MISKAFKSISFQLITPLALSFLLLSATVAPAQLLDRVIAVVNEDIITHSELEEAAKEFISKVQSTAPETEREVATQQVKERVLNQLINQRLISQQAKQANIKLSNEELEKVYRKNVEKMKLSQEEWLQKLKEAGLSEETYKSNLKNQILRDKLVLYEVRSKIIVTDEMINEHYNTEYTVSSKEGGYYLLQMGFPWGKTEEVKSNPGLVEADKARAMKKANEIRSLVIDGGNFAELAREHSELPSAADGGDLGIFQEDELAGYMKKSIVGLEVGEVSPVVETPLGYQFFKILSHSKGEFVHQVPLFEVKEEIRNKLFDQEFQREYAEWVDEIKKGSYIKKMLSPP